MARRSSALAGMRCRWCLRRLRHRHGDLGSGQRQERGRRQGSGRRLPIRHLAGHRSARDASRSSPGGTGPRARRGRTRPRPVRRSGRRVPSCSGRRTLRAQARGVGGREIYAAPIGLVDVVPFSLRLPARLTDSRAREADRPRSPSRAAPHQTVGFASWKIQASKKAVRSISDFCSASAMNSGVVTLP